MRKILDNIYKYIGSIRIFRKARKSYETFKMQERTQEKLNLAIKITNEAIERNKRDNDLFKAAFPNIESGVGRFSTGENVVPENMKKSDV